MRSPSVTGLKRSSSIRGKQLSSIAVRNDRSQMRLESIHAGIKGLTNESGQESRNRNLLSDGGQGSSSITPARFNWHRCLAEGQIEVKSLQLKGLRPYYESMVGIDITEGSAGSLHPFCGRAEGRQSSLRRNLTELNADLRSLRLDVPGDREPLWRAPLLAIKDTAVDVAKKSIAIGAFESQGWQRLCPPRSGWDHQLRQNCQNSGP